MKKQGRIADSSVDIAKLVGAVISFTPGANLGMALIPLGISVSEFLLKKLQTADFFKESIPEKLHSQMHEAIDIALKETKQRISISNHRALLEEAAKEKHLFANETLSPAEVISNLEEIISSKEFQGENYFSHQDIQDIITVFYTALRNEILRYPELAGYIHWEAIDSIIQTLESHEEILVAHEERITQLENSSKRKSDERLITAPPMASTLNFVGREREEQKINDLIKNNQKLILIHGIGGIGKSSIVKKLFHKWNDEGLEGCDEIAHFGWIPYTGKIKHDLAVSLHLTNKIANTEDAYREAIRYINELGKKLVLFIDNVNNPPQEDILILTSLTCNVILTSRTQRIAQYESVDIGKLSEDECLNLYVFHCPEAKDNEDVREIIKKADYHTLAVELLAKTQEASGKTPQEIFEIIDEAGFDLEGIDETVERDGDEAVFIEHIAKLFSLAEISDEQKHVLQLFAVLPYKPLYGERMKKWFGEKNYNNVNALVKSGWLIKIDNTAFFIERFKNKYGEKANSYVNAQIKSGEIEALKFQMHPIIAETVLHNAAPKYTDMEYLIRAITENIALENQEEFTKKLQFISFGESAADYCIKLRTENADIIQLEYNMGFILCDAGHYEEAHECYKKAIEISERLFGKDHPDTAVSYSNIAGFYLYKGKYDKALEWHEKALVLREQLLGKNHPDTAAAYHNIGDVYLHKGKYDKALEWNEKALVIQESVLGTDSLDTAATYNNIGNVYLHKGKYDKALEWYEKARVIRESLLGKEHRDTLTNHSNIAVVYSYQGEYHKALELLENARVIRGDKERVLWRDYFDISVILGNMAKVYLHNGIYDGVLGDFKLFLNLKEMFLGKDHPDTASSYYNIASFYLRKGEYNTALEWSEKALAIRERVLGKDHPDTAATYDNIANVYLHKWEYNTALEWSEKALSIRERVLGKDHPDTAESYNTIALVYSQREEYDKALEYLGKALIIREDVLGKEHLDTAVIYHNIARVYIRREEFDFNIDYCNKTALEWLEKALAIRDRILGNDRFDTAATCDNIAGIYILEGKFDEAFEISERVLGKDHPDTVSIYDHMGAISSLRKEYKQILELNEQGNSDIETALGYTLLAFVYSHMGDYDKSLEYYEKTLVISEQILGKNHLGIVFIYNRIANVYYSMGNYDKELACHEKVLMIQEAIQGKDFPEITSFYQKIVNVYCRMGKYDKALERYEKILAIQEKTLGKEHSDTAATYHAIGGVYHTMKDYVKAIEWYETALIIRKKVLGENHQDTEISENCLDNAKFDEGLS
jgi:tetratricopeptide (TPR) repeat protein